MYVFIHADSKKMVKEKGITFVFNYLWLKNMYQSEIDPVYNKSLCFSLFLFYNIKFFQLFIDDIYNWKVLCLEILISNIEVHKKTMIFLIFFPVRSLIIQNLGKFSERSVAYIFFWKIKTNIYTKVKYVVVILLNSNGKW